MTQRGGKTARLIASGLLAWLVPTGCTSFTRTPIREGAYIHGPVARPELPPPRPTPPLPEPPSPPPRTPTPTPSGEPLRLEEVLESVATHFPLLYAAEQERAIAAGQRLAAEGQFDTLLRLRGADQGGSFSNGRLDAGVEQPTPFAGASVFAGWRLGLGNFPVYYGDRKTGQGGEYRAGVTLPLLQNREIDPRRARLRAAQIAEQLADPVVRRARLDYFRGAAQAYWTWAAAGAQYRVAEDLVRLARDRQALLEEQRKQGAVGEAVPTLNRRLLAGREEQLLAADRALQQSALRLSLFLRDTSGEPVIPHPVSLPREFDGLEPNPPNPAQLAADVQAALAFRPELERFRLLKERAGVELKLAENQTAPTFSVSAGVAQDTGFAKKTFTGTGPFATDRTTPEVGAVFEVPLQRRDAVGRVRTARAQLAQLLAQERYARDEITAQVQDAVSEMDRTYQRLGKAREELRAALRVRELETESFRAGRTSLIDLNLQEIAAAEAQAKVVAILAAYLRAVADYHAALGLDTPTGESAPARQPQ